MSYSIYIGELHVPGFDKDDLEYISPGEQIAASTPEAKSMEHPDAPTFINDEMTGQSNGRHPSYSGWHSFVREAGIEAMWYGDSVQEGFLNSHPGCALLGPDHLKEVQAALERRKATNGGKEPGFSGFMSGEERPDLDGCLARLIWLEFWMRYALEHCEVPVVSNY